MILALLACGTPAGSAEDELAEALDAIGYTSGYEEPTAEGGVVVHRRDAVQPGVTLVIAGHEPAARLVDIDGNELHTWRSGFASTFGWRHTFERRRQWWRQVELLPDGGLVGVWEPVGAFRIDRDSNVVWAVQDGAHHDLQVLPDGRLLTLTEERGVDLGVDGIPMVAQYLVTLDLATGQELDRVALAEVVEGWQALRTAFWELEDRRDSHLNEAGARKDPFHANSVHLLTAGEAAALGPPFQTG
ncbi:MAG: hypothetical protein KC656_32765, partial [Myxococcales bacterium]|nr:hypothetical protein [Myxococcales bacterium]